MYGGKQTKSLWKREKPVGRRHAISKRRLSLSLSLLAPGNVAHTLVPSGYDDFETRRQLPDFAAPNSLLDESADLIYLPLSRVYSSARMRYLLFLFARPSLSLSLSRTDVDEFFFTT